jgi:hypothetical protein
LLMTTKPCEAKSMDFVGFFRRTRLGHNYILLVFETFRRY